MKAQSEALLLFYRSKWLIWRTDTLLYVSVCLCVHTWMRLRVLIFLSASFLIFTSLAYLNFSICLWTISQSFLRVSEKMMENTILWGQDPNFLAFSIFPPRQIEILLVCLYGIRDENDFVDRKKNGNGREGVGDKKKWQRIENRWEMKYIRTPEARSRGYDLSRHTVVPHWAGGSKWVGERVGRQRGGGGGKAGFT